MSNPARKAYYAEARRLTRRPRWLHLTRYHVGGPYTVTLGGGQTLTGENFIITFGPASRRRLPNRLPPVLEFVGPFAETWAVN